MGDGFSDQKRDDRREKDRQAQLDHFFELVAEYLGENQAELRKRDVLSAFVDYDTFLYDRVYFLAMERQEKRKRAFSRRLTRVGKEDWQAWAELLTEAKRRASKYLFEELHELSPFAEKPVLIFVPSGEYGQPQVIGDWRGFHDLVAQGAAPKAFVVTMAERSVKGLSRDGEIRKGGWDDVRFLSF